MKKEYDVVIIGGGPAGAMAAIEASKSSLSVCLLEKISKIGGHIRCGEAISESSLKEFVDPKEEWIARRINSCKIFSPSEILLESKFSEKNNAFVLNRNIFDYDLSLIAKRNGVEIYNNAYAEDIILDNQFIDSVLVRYNGQTQKIKSKIFIAADGIESRIGRKAGIKTQVKMKDMESGFQYLVENIDIDPNSIQMYVGLNVAPGGYLWVFPKSKTSANIGIGISGKHSPYKSAKRYLDDFILRKYSKGKIKEHITGGIPCSKPIKKPFKGNLMLVGDAAHHINPLTGGGIGSAMRGGRHAGEIARSAIKDNNFIPAIIERYEKRLNSDFVKRYKKLYNIREAVSKLSDNDYDSIALSISKIPREKLTLTKIFRKAVYKKPSLVFDVAKVLSGY